MKSKIKIALFSEVLKENLDGVTNTLYQIFERIPKDKFEFIFITPYPPSDEIDLGYPIYECKYFRFPLHKTYRVALPKLNKDLEDFLDDFSPDIVHITTPFTLGKYAQKYALKRNIPVVSIYHTHFMTYIDYYFKKFYPLYLILNKYGWRYFAKFYNKCEITYVPTETIYEELINNKVAPDKLSIWGRGVNTKKFNPKHKDLDFLDKIAKEQGINNVNDKQKVLFVSRLVWEKELKTLIGVYKKLTKLRSDIQFIVTGSGPKMKALKKAMPEAIFTGKLLGEKLSKIFASSDIFFFPSITETFGNVVLEAMASGLPVVVAKKGGPYGYVQDNFHGLHANPKDIDDFLNKIKYLIDNPKEAERMGKNALAYANKQNWDELVKEFFNNYKKIHEKWNNKK